MDSVTQIAFGAAVGGAVAGRQAGWRAFAWGAAAGTMPDLDTFWDYGSPVANFTWHRGYTHSLFVQTLAAPIVAWPIWRLHRAGGVGYPRWLALVWLVFITHAFLDAFTIYGTQLWLPFSDYPAGLGSIFIIDPLYTLPLIVGVIAALRCRGDWPCARRRNAVGLTLATAYLAWTVGAQQWMEQRAWAEVERRDMPVERLLATPTAVNSVLWRIVAVGGDRHWEALHPIGSDRPIRFRVYERRPQLLEPLADHPPVRRLQYFTKGFYTVEQRGTEVVISDLRMGQVGFYAFAYSVGHIEDGEPKPAADRRFRFERPPLPIALTDLFNCARGQPTQAVHCATPLPH